mmetsp:Transcript_110572/g.247105  ORF Transcript_110572/g.247105 Transcript_110572/m.247105 type:complete len:96 (-) Transcript_110572:69-356(-)
MPDEARPLAVPQGVPWCKHEHHPHHRTPPLPRRKRPSRTPPSRAQSSVCEISATPRFVQKRSEWGGLHECGICNHMMKLEECPLVESTPLRSEVL